MATFVSYHLGDRTQRDQLVRLLSEAGVEVWDPGAMMPGRSLREQLRAGIRSCTQCVFLATAASIDSRWCQTELGAFWGTGKRVLILLTSPDLRGKVPPQYQPDLFAGSAQDVVRALAGALPRTTHPYATLAYFGHDARDEQKRAVLRQSLKRAEAVTVQEMESLEPLEHVELSDWRGIFLAMPYATNVSAHVVERIVRWVWAGGRLAVSGFELGERHHKTNINQLLYHFGLSLNSDVVVNPGMTGAGYDKDYDVTLSYRASGSHPLCDGIDNIALKNACSLHLEPGAVPLVLTGMNQIRELSEGHYQAPTADELASAPFAPVFQLANGAQRFGPPGTDARRAVVAEAPRGLTLKGRVLVLGSWDFRSDGRNDNDSFLTNLWRWLGGVTG